MQTVQAADFPYISCNFRYEADGVPGDRVLEPFWMTEAAGKKMAFVGITTPETLSSTSPTYFQNADGEYIYGISGGDDGAALYRDVQSAIHAADAAGADYIIALGHLGIDPSSAPWTSREVIANTAGLSAFIDGHSHSTVEAETVYDKDGNAVILTQTGSYFDAVGKMTISPDGRITAELLTSEELTAVVPDAAVKAIEDAWVREIDRQLGKVIGYAKITLDNFDADGSRLVRKQETNSGDFAADALYYFFDKMGLDVDVAVMNGGGIRNTAVTGELTYLTCKEIHTFGNVACLQTVTGQQLLDALEWACARLMPDGTAEDGSFLHVSGIRYTVDLTVPSTVRQNEKGIWTAGPKGEYRVRNVEVYDRATGVYEPLQLAAEYNLAGYNYTLRDLGGGFAMFEHAVNVLDYAAEDYMVLADYIQSFPVNAQTGLPTIKAEDGYSEVTGSGRITLITRSQPAEETADTVYTVQPGDTLWSLARSRYGSGAKWNILYAANADRIRDPRWILAGQTLIVPQA